MSRKKIILFQTASIVAFAMMILACASSQGAIENSNKSNNSEAEDHAMIENGCDTDSVAGNYDLAYAGR